MRSQVQEIRRKGRSEVGESVSFSVNISVRNSVCVHPKVKIACTCMCSNELNEGPWCVDKILLHKYSTYTVMQVCM